MTLRLQCWLFAVGATFFAVATAPGVPAVVTATGTNVLCFIGSWFFTSAAFIQWRGAGPQVPERLSASTQLAGTVMFNLSTGAAVWAHRVPAERDFVWTPDAFGSTLFLVSSAVAVYLVVRGGGWLRPDSREWQAGWLNLIGSVAFGASAVGAVVRGAGTVADQRLANVGTFVGALCFLVAALVTLPARAQSARADANSPG
ncbi:hypothetical protein [[Mycobacterium] burgundiense]|uniref:YrhK domain-containing protein n=1 Tax=[Mycobacterium] burgundiense TaxID=3064286 RepID=A0ABM9LER8_9MYCO|nr:hypothetical protein [Mycolicibacterium sp. MU0053]CAJ1497732.1 hypothetical protein MU0053_000982 [Mycolicibacterium sp. MU0053]